MSTAVRPNIDWVGYVDWAVRDFHSYQTDHGSTYNAYLLRDGKTALIDTVRAPYGQQLLANVAALADLAKIDYVVCNHAEPDHAGALPEVMRACPRATLLCNAKCRAALAAHFDISAWPIELVATGDCIRLGRRTLRFIETPMVHWPESMFTYIPEDKLLFSMDAFGQHYASSQRFDDELPLEAILLEAKTYYANIIMPYGKAVAACIAKTAGLEIDVIAPSHGAIWRTGVAKILAAYHDWVAYRPKAKVLVLYDSMWESTARMAQAIAEGVAQQPGVEMQQLPLRGTSLTRIAAEVLDAAAVAFGSATLNRGMMPAAAAALHYLQGLRPLGKAGLAFGSYGWGGGGVEAIEAGLKAMPWDVIGPPLKAQYRPTAEILRQCRAAGKQLAEKASALAGVRSINGIAGLVSPYG